MVRIFILWIFFILLEQKTSLNYVWKMWKKYCCGVSMLSEDTKILMFNQYQKYHITLSIIYADLESLIKKVDVYKDNHPQQKVNIFSVDI